MYPVLIKLFDLEITSWSFFVIIGIFSAYLTLRKNLKFHKIRELEIYTFYFGTVLSWFLGAFLGQVFFVKRSGLVLMGGVFLCFIFGFFYWFFSNWRNKFAVGRLADYGALALCWACFWARIGCILQGCCYGTPSNTWPGYTLNFERWPSQALAFPEHLTNIKLHPVPLYEAIGLFLIALLLHFTLNIIRKHPKTVIPGLMFFITGITYSILRFCLEFIRGDDRGQMMLGFTASQLLSVGAILIVLILMSIIKTGIYVPPDE